MTVIMGFNELYNEIQRCDKKLDEPPPVGNGRARVTSASAPRVLQVFAVCGEISDTIGHMIQD
jgi:hypothetical protein